MQLQFINILFIKTANGRQQVVPKKQVGRVPYAAQLIVCGGVGKGNRYCLEPLLKDMVREHSFVVPFKISLCALLSTVSALKLLNKRVEIT